MVNIFCAQNILTICCTGAHLLPNTGNEIRLPATATAHRTPAVESFLMLFIIFPVHTKLKP
jgi:hypothetical protein